MKELIDWMWRTRRNRQGDEDKKWAPAAEIPRQLRPKLNQILQYDWPNMNPYPGWVLAIEQGCSGWKCKLMNEKELKAYEIDEVKNKNPKSQKRANEVAWAAKKRAEKAASSSSGPWKDKASENETRNNAEAENDPANDIAEQKETSTTSDAEDSCSAESVVPDDDIRKKCIEELGVSMDEIHGTMLSLYMESGNLSHACDYDFLGMGASIAAKIPKAVTPLHMDTKYTYERPSVFVLTSTNVQTKKQGSTRVL